MDEKPEWMWSAASCGLNVGREENKRKVEEVATNTKRVRTRKVTFASHVTVIGIPRVTKQDLESETEDESEDAEAFVDRLFNSSQLSEPVDTQ